MANEKKVFGAIDTAPVTLYAKQEASSDFSYPLLQGMFNPGFSIPAYDSILVTYSSGNPTHVYYLSSGSTIATLLVTYSSGSPTHVYRV